MLLFSRYTKVFSPPPRVPSHQKTMETAGPAVVFTAGCTDAEKQDRSPNNSNLSNHISMHAISGLIQGNQECIDELVGPDDPNGPTVLSSFNNGRSALQLWPPGVHPNINTSEDDLVPL